MRRLGMMAGVLAVSIVCFPVPASAQDTVEKLRADLTELQKKVDALQKERDLDRQISEQERKAFRERIKQLEDDLDRLRRTTSTSRRQFSFDPSTEMGTVVLRNQLDVSATVTIGSVSYVVRARSTRTLSDVPVGPIRYVVTADGWGVSPVRRTTVAASDPLTITIYDTRREFDR